MTWYDYNNNGSSPLTPAQYDREIITLCGPNGSIVLLQDVTSVEAPIGTTPTILAWNLDATPYTGVISELKKFEHLNDIEVETTDYCANGVNVQKVQGFNLKDGVVLWTVWLNDTGDVIQSPVLPIHSVYGGSYGQPLTTQNFTIVEKGLCKITSNLNKKIYLSENTGILSIQDIILQLPLNSVIESITILQDVGVGFISADAGSSVTMKTGRVISYSIDDLGNFNSSNLTMDAGTIITAATINPSIHSTYGGHTGGYGQTLTTNTVYSTQLGVQSITIIYSN